MDEEITIIGAGLAGTLLALELANLGHHVHLFESRKDLRTHSPDSGRSINLALSMRGLTALEAFGLKSEVLPLTVPMRARAIHEQNGSIFYQPFGRTASEHIYAIARNDLNIMLLEHASQHPRVSLHFEVALQSLDIKKHLLYYSSPQNHAHQHVFSHLIAADGATSFVREVLKEEQEITAQRTFLPIGYKELSIAKAEQNHLAKEHLHLWPRDSLLLLGNPNIDGSITGTLFLPLRGEDSVESIQDESLLRQLFEKYFPDAYPHMPQLEQEFFSHPTGNVSTITAHPWYDKTCSCLLIGDAAHGMIPFFGQGMNCAFEDCRILTALWREHKGNWQKIMPQFYTQRKPNADAVAAMSLDNYHEIRHHIRDPHFNLKKQLHFELMKRYPNQYVSKHILVMFTNTSYATAQKVGELQEILVTTIVKQFPRIESIDWSVVDKLMAQYDKNLAMGE